MISSDSSFSGRSCLLWKSVVVDFNRERRLPLARPLPRFRLLHLLACIQTTSPTPCICHAASTFITHYSTRRSGAPSPCLAALPSKVHTTCEDANVILFLQAGALAPISEQVTARGVLDTIHTEIREVRDSILGWFVPIGRSCWQERQRSA